MRSFVRPAHALVAHVQGALSATSHCPQRRANIKAHPGGRPSIAAGRFCSKNLRREVHAIHRRTLCAEQRERSQARWSAAPSWRGRGLAGAQTYGFATLQPGTLNHTTASAVAKVLKEKAGLNVLVQPTAGDQVIVPMVDRGEAEIGISNAMEVHDGWRRASRSCASSRRRIARRFFVRKDGGIRTVADLKGKRVPYGFSAMRALEPTVRAIWQPRVSPEGHQAGSRAQRDPQRRRFRSGAADAFYFAFGAPKVRGRRHRGRHPHDRDRRAGDAHAARKIERWGYLTEIGPGPVFVGVEKPMKVYSFDNLLFTNAKTSDEFVYKILDTLFKNKDDLIAVQPVLREFSPAFGYKQYEVAYHPGAVKYFKSTISRPRRWIEQADNGIDRPGRMPQNARHGGNCHANDTISDRGLHRRSRAACATSPRAPSPTASPRCNRLRSITRPARRSPRC